MQDSETATESDSDLIFESGSRPTSIYGSHSDDIQVDASADRDKEDHQRHWMEYDQQELSDDAEADPRPQDDMVSDLEGGQELEELASDNESEFDEWKDFDEVNEAALSDEEKLQEFEEILGAEEYAELWASRLYLFLSL